MPTNNLVEATPIAGLDRLTAIENAVKADEPALFGANANGTATDIVLGQLVAPTGTAVTVNGTVGTTSYAYAIADVSNFSQSPATAVSNTVGNATLTAANSVTITWNGIAGHSYNVYRTTAGGTPSTTGFIGNVVAAANAAVSFVDTGIAATGSGAPSANTTGSLSVAGPTFLNGTLLKSINPQTLATTGAATLTIAQMTNEILVSSGATTNTLTTPTAAALVAAFPGVKANQGFTLLVQNANTGTLTIAGGTRVTAANSSTLTTISVNARQFTFVFTNVTAGSEAVSIYDGGVAVY